MGKQFVDTAAQRESLAAARLLWSDIDFQYLVMSDRLTLVDESENFGISPYSVRDNLRYQTHYPGEVEFKLLCFFGEPRERAEVERYFEEGLSADLSDPCLVVDDLGEYMDALLAAGLLKTTSVKEHEIANSRESRSIHFRAPALQHHDKVVRSFPKTIGLNITERCNLACKHCSVGSNPFVSTANDLTTEQAKKLFDDLDDAGLESLRITGGEPMMRPDFWELFDYAIGCRFSLTLFTNGTRVDRAAVERFAEARRKRGSRFLIHLSLDGGTAYSHDYLRNREGNFERVKRTMGMFREAGVPFYVESVLHERSATVEEVEALAELVADHGVTYLSLHPGELIGTGENESSLLFTREFLKDFSEQIQPIVDRFEERGLTISFDSYTFPLGEPTEAHELARRLEQQQKGGQRALAVVGEDEIESADDFRQKMSSSRASGFNVCTAGISQLALGADGDVYGCPRYVGAKAYSTGNVKTRNISEIWAAPGWDFLREDYQPKLKLCGDCNYKNNCFYGKTCRANPGYLFNDIYGVSPECVVEYQALGLPFEKVEAYLLERIEANRDNLRVVSLCERLLKIVRHKEHVAVAETPTDASGEVS